MNVSPVAGSTGSAAKQNGAVEALQQLKAQLTNQLKKVNESTEDAKTKAAKIKQLNEEIAAVDAQIQQAVAGEKQKELQEAVTKAQEKAAEQQAEKEEASGVVISASLGKVMAIGRNMAEYQSLGRVRTQLLGEKRVAQGELELSAASGGSIEYQLDVIASNTSRLAKVEHEMGKAAGTIREGIEASVKAGTKEAEKARDNKEKAQEETTAGSAAGGEAEATGRAQGAAADAQAGGPALPADEADKKDGSDKKDNERKPKSIDVMV